MKSLQPQRFYWILIIVFLSGFAALTYQIVWFREIQQVFGVHVFSVAAVLSAFMAGLATGSFIFGSWADKVKNPMLLFAILELTIGIFALLFIFFFPFSLQGYYFLIDQYAFNTLQINTIRFFYSFILLVIPSTFMGGVIPVVSKILIDNTRTLGKKISLIYALNNLGAAIGCLMTGFLLIRMLGVNETLGLAAGLNIFNAIVVFLLLPGFKSNKQTEYITVDTAPKQNPKYSPVFIKVILWVFALEGFTTLAYQVLWTRLLIEFAYDKTVYIYSVIITGFIIGLSVGGFVAKNHIDKLKNLPNILAWAQVLIGFTSFVLLLTFIFISPTLVQQRAAHGSWMLIAGKEYLAIFLILILPVTLMGFTFPLVSKIYTSQKRSIGKSIGRIGFLDTIGSVFGSFVAAFFMIPLLGIYFSFLTVVLINIIMGVFLWILNPHLKGKKYYLSLVASAIILLLFFLPSNKTYFEKRVNYYPTDKVISYAEGVAATVSVHVLPSRHKALAINGSKTAFTTDADLKVHGMLATLPYLLTQSADHAFVIGFGMGVTTHHLASLNIPRVQVAELSPQVVRTSLTRFASLNQQVHLKDNVDIAIEDGRSFLISSNQKWDLITSNAIHARLGANLYTRDFYQICHDNLSEHGIVCQWLPTNWMTDNEFRALVKSFTDVFPKSVLWYVTRGHFLITGSKGDIHINFNQFRDAFRNPHLRQALLEMDIQNPAQLLAHAIADPEDLKQFTLNAPVNSDDYPTVEFSTETDLKPNTEVLRSILTLQFNHQQYTRMDQTESPDNLLRDVQMLNILYRSELENYVLNYE